MTSSYNKTLNDQPVWSELLTRQEMGEHQNFQSISNFFLFFLPNSNQLKKNNNCDRLNIWRYIAETGIFGAIAPRN